MESDHELFKKFLEWKATQPGESVEQNAGSSTRKDRVREKAIDHFQKPQEAGSSTSIDEVEEKVESEKATASDYFKKQVKGLKTTTAALKFRVSWNCAGLQTGWGLLGIAFKNTPLARKRNRVDLSLNIPLL